jgi:hypothetical protein
LNQQSNRIKCLLNVILDQATGNSNQLLNQVFGILVRVNRASRIHSYESNEQGLADQEPQENPDLTFVEMD